MIRTSIFISLLVIILSGCVEVQETETFDQTEKPGSFSESVETINQLKAGPANPNPEVEVEEFDCDADTGY